MLSLADVTLDCIRGFRSARLQDNNMVRVELMLQRVGAPNDVRHSQLVTADINLEVYSRWRFGSAGAATYTSVSPPSDFTGGSGNLERMFIQLDIPINEIDKFNDADEFRFTRFGDTYICEITQPEFLVQDGVRSYINQSFNSYTLNKLLSATIDELESNQVRVRTTHGFDVGNASLYLASISGLSSTRTSDFPIIMAATNNDSTIAGAYATSTALVLEFRVGGAKSGNVLSLPVTLTRRPGAMAGPTVPDLSETTVRIVNVESEHEGEVTVEWEITPTLSATDGGEIRLISSETMPQMRSLGRSATSNLLRTSITRAGIERGKSYSVVVEYRKSSTEIYRSSPTFFKYAERIILQSDVEHLSQQVRTAKIFMTDLTDTSVTFDVIQDIFLSNFVSALKLTRNPGAESDNVVVDNPSDNSVIEIGFTGLQHVTAYQVKFIAETQFGDVEIAGIQVTTLLTLPERSTAQDRQSEMIDKILYMAYDSDILKIVDTLPQDCQINLAEDALKRLNVPESDGHIHDFNKFNKRGSIFGKQTSDLSKAKYQEVIDIALGDIATVVPDIDVGAPS